MVSFCPPSPIPTQQGQLLCDTRFAPRMVSRTGMVVIVALDFESEVGGQSVTHSECLPKAFRMEAVQVSRSLLQDSEWKHVHQEHRTDIAGKEKYAFETAFDIDAWMPEYLRVAEKDQNGWILTYRELVIRTAGNAPSTLIRNLLFTVCLPFGCLPGFFPSSSRNQGVLESQRPRG
ncbi:hypothetical protein F5X99DRAFT_387287 [Biscogniauxia marginata]|nr:hypothetical protein F5X99DRAFT_387287 [Biscogniauxia marginata]